MLKEFVAHKVALTIPGQGINTSASPEMLLDVLGCIAAFKRSIAVERINAGLAHARRRGVKFGRPVKVSAYRDAVARLRAKGLTGRAIGKALGVPSSNVFRIIGQLEAAV